MEEKRLIQSYGRKRARGLSDAQKTNLESLYNLYGISVPEAETNPKDFFLNDYQQMYCEIGFGNGEHLIQNAKNHPNIAFIGCEPFENGVAATLAKIHEQKLSNVRIYKGDARVLLDKIKDSSFDCFYVLFPDPWHKKRHHKRRLLSEDFIKTLQRKAKSEGQLVIATDCEDYMQQIQETLKTLNLSHEDDLNTLQEKPDWFLNTKYESKAISQNRPCYYQKIALNAK